MRRLPFVLAAALVGAAVAPASAAGPIHLKLEPNPSFVVTGACAFSAEYSDLRVHGNLLDFVDRAGEFKKTIIAGNFVVRVTNLETDNAITLNISGQFIFTPNPDGSQGSRRTGATSFSRLIRSRSRCFTAAVPFSPPRRRATYWRWCSIS